MQKRVLLSVLSILLFVGVFYSEAFADQEWISDILLNPSRFWNTRVSVEGQVQTVTANPAGTTRGEYTILDDSGKNALIVRTDKLPPVGETFVVTGMILRDPENTAVTYMKEMKRAAPGMPNNMKILLFGGGLLFLILLIIFIVLLVKPKEKAVAVETVKPVAPAEPTLDKTTKIAPEPAAAAAIEDKTQVFMSLGADFIVDKGPDKDKEFTLHKQATTIGRAGSRKNDIELQDDTVSKEQATVVYDNTTKKFSLTNESATNPTMVNGNVTSGNVVLNNDDLIEMGKTVLKFKTD